MLANAMSSSEKRLRQTVSGVGAIPTQEQFGATSAYEPAREEWLIEGYLEALGRFRSATQLGADADAPRKTFIPLFDALACAASLIERVLEPKPKSKQTKPKPSPLQGARYVRNRVQHQWAVALRGRDVTQPRTMRAAGHSQVIEPAVVYDWFWKPLAELPEPPPEMGLDELGRDSYEKYLDGQPARLALDAIENTLKQRLGI
jgi:hypothetical protein